MSDETMAEAVPASEPDDSSTPARAPRGGGGGDRREQHSEHP